MEKLVHLLWRSDGHDEAAHRAHLIDEVAPQVLASSAGVRGLEVLTADTSQVLPQPALFMGRAPDLASVVTTWVDCLDDRAPLLELLGSAEGTSGQVDQHLVTESVPQRFEGRDWVDGTPTPGITHFSWFPKPERLTDEQFFRGWHEVHTPKTPELHPERTEYVRDTVHRVLTPGSPPVRALVQERFPLEVYADPSRLYGSDAAMEESVTDLPLYADFESLSTRPLHQTVVRSAPLP